jgi:AraC-like DNA-binding protein
LRGFAGVSAAANQIVHGAGSVPIATLAANAGLSMRQFERKFFQQVGVRPKLFSRIVRFEAALDSKARSSTKSWTDVAHEFGYFDQMHMVHDFEKFTGQIPTYTLNQMEILFLEQIQAMRSGGTSAIPGEHSRLMM